MEQVLREYFAVAISQIATLDTQVILLVVLCAVALIVWDSMDLGSKRKMEDSGIKTDAVTVSIDGSKTFPVRDYVSEIQGIAGKPDALVVEDGFIIPIERKPLARKLRDRYVAQLLIYMRLVEEFEGKRPPYGYLILGSQCRRFKIMNSPERQAWLDKMLGEMREILEGAPAKPAPHPRKCARCDVKDACQYRMDRAVATQEPLVQLKKDVA